MPRGWCCLMPQAGATCGMAGRGGVVPPPPTPPTGGGGALNGKRGFCGGGVAVRVAGVALARRAGAGQTSPTLQTKSPNARPGSDAAHPLHLCGGGSGWGPGCPLPQPLPQGEGGRETRRRFKRWKGGGPGGGLYSGTYRGNRGSMAAMKRCIRASAAASSSSANIGVTNRIIAPSARPRVRLSITTDALTI